MTGLDDDQDMRRIDELLLAGEPVPEEPELSALVATLRARAEAPAPLPTPALERVLRTGLTPDVEPPVPLSARRRAVPVGTLAKIGIAAAVAAAVTTGAAALELPPSVREPARSFVSGIADLLTPWADDDTDQTDQTGEAVDGGERGGAGEPNGPPDIPPGNPRDPAPPDDPARPDWHPSTPERPGEGGEAPGRQPSAPPGQGGPPGSPDTVPPENGRGGGDGSDAATQPGSGALGRASAVNAGEEVSPGPYPSSGEVR